MKMTKNLFLLIFGILIVLNIIMVFRFNNLNKNYSEIKFLYAVTKENDSKNSSLLAEMRQNLLTQNLIEQKINDENILLIDENLIALNMSDVVKDGKNLLVFRFHESSCYPCIRKYLSRLQNTIKIKDNVIIIASFVDTEIFNNNFNTLGIKTYFTNAKLCDFDTEEKPYFFILNKSLTLQNGFIPIEKDLPLIDQYCRLIIEN